MEIGRESGLGKILIPRYNELALYLMSIAFLLLFFSQPDLRESILKTQDNKFDPRWYLAACVFAMGIFYSLHHVFTSRAKTDLEKHVMLAFAVLVNAFSGIKAGMHMLEQSEGLLLVFPFWNIFNGFVLLIMFRAKVIDESCIIDDNATPPQVIFGTLIVIATFVACEFVFNIYWAITFSLCVTYASNIDSTVQGVFLKQRSLGVAG